MAGGFSRFVVGAGSGANYSPGDTGGSANATLVSHSHTINNHTHTINNHTHSFSGSTNNPGNHSHSYSKPNTTNDDYRGTPIGDNGQIGHTFGNFSTGGAGGHTHSFSGNTGNPSNRGTGNPSNRGTNSQGSSSTNANLPPYYALCYIMKS